MSCNAFPTQSPPTINDGITSVATAIEVVIVLLNEDWSLSFRLRSLLNLLELWWNKSEVVFNVNVVKLAISNN